MCAQGRMTLSLTLGALCLTISQQMRGGLMYAYIELQIEPQMPYWVEVEYLSPRGEWRPLPSFREWARNGVCRKFIYAADICSKFSYRWSVFSPTDFTVLGRSSVFKFPKERNDTITSFVVIQPCVV